MKSAYLFTIQTQHKFFLIFMLCRCSLFCNTLCIVFFLCSIFSCKLFMFFVHLRIVHASSIPVLLFLIFSSCLSSVVVHHCRLHATVLLCF